MNDRKMPRQIVLFDLDRTITRIGTFTPFCLYAAWRLNPLRLLAVPVAALALGATGLKLTSRKTLKTMMLALLIGRRSRADIDRVADGFVDLFLRRQIRNQARDTINDARADGAALYMATASYDFYAERFANRLGFNGCIATRSLWRDGRLVPGIDGENCYGPEKLRRMQEHLLADGLLDPSDQSTENRATTNRATITFYSDDRSDLPGLLWADRAVVVSPKDGFAKVARSHGLEVQEW